VVTVTVGVHAPSKRAKVTKGINSDGEKRLVLIRQSPFKDNICDNEEINVSSQISTHNAQQWETGHKSDAKAFSIPDIQASRGI
jgi:hypothetical protein